MKKTLIPWLAALFLLQLLRADTAIAQDDTASIKAAMESRRYVFTAETMTPFSGRLRQLTSEYDLRVWKDSVIAFLPYFGRAYTAPIDPNDGGIKFTSVKFDYKSAKKKKAWEIDIRPKDARDIQELMLTVFENGSASLRVTSVNRQPISFNGYVRPK